MRDRQGHHNRHAGARPFVVVKKPRPLPGLDGLIEAAGRLSLVILAVIGLIYAAQAWSGFLAPLLAGLIFGLMFSPAVAAFERYGLAPAASVAILFGLLLSGGYLAVVLLWEPVSAGAAELPNLAAAFKVKLDQLAHGLRDLLRFERTIDAIDLGAEDVPQVEVKQGTMLAGILSIAPPALAQVLLFLGTVIFFLSTRKRIRNNVLRLCLTRSARLRAARIMRDIEINISRYLLTITIINLALGVVVGVAMSLVGMDSALMWGVAAGVLNFIPYLGPMVMFVLLFGVQLAASAPVSELLLPVMVYAAINFVEFQLVTPAILGRSLTLNPFAVFISIAFWMWLWGPLGAFLAVPVLLMAAVAASHILPAA